MIDSRSLPESSSRRIPLLFGILVAVAFLLCRLPYRGLRHDGVLYVGQALAHLDPSWATHDFFFASGSQDRYSIFSNVVAFLITHFSIGTVDIAVLLGAWALLIGAVFALGRGLESRHRWLGVLAVICVSHFYASKRMFGFMETFVTARTVAEPLALVTLACVTRGRYALAALFLGLTLVVHPLIGVPTAAIFLAYLVSLDRRWLWALLALVPVGGLALKGIAPFSALLQSYDEPWFQITMRSNWAVFESTWLREDVAEAVAVLGLLLIANRGERTPLARLCIATFWTTIALCAVSFIGADTQHNILITQLQLWRALWIANLLAMLSMPAWFAREWRKGLNGRVAAVAVFVAIFTADSWIKTSWAIVAWAALALLISARGAPLKPRMAYLAIFATVAAGVIMTQLQVVNDFGQLQMHKQGLAIARVSSIPAQLPMLTIPLALALFVGWGRGGALRAASVAAALALLVFGATQWDQRTPWSRFIESSRPGQHPFAALIPPGSQVYWHEDTVANWVLLQRPQFISDFQLSGLLFNRATAMTAAARLPALFAIRAPDDDCTNLEWWGADPKTLDSCKLPRQAFLDMCHAKPDHADFLVGPVDFGVGVISRWQFKPEDGSPPVTYLLYDCKKVP